jgi:hypothetical protein|tara:strand:+ start:1383 stop:1745 length:363 start_codon:yes stop_codon:yes gene_type:complete
MADTGIFATTAEVQRKVHVNASATSNTEAYINQFMTEAESLINVTCTQNFSDDFAGLDADVKGILKMAASELAASMVESFDLDVIGRGTALTSINAHLTKYDMAIKELKIKDAQNFMDDA